MLIITTTSIINADVKSFVDDIIYDFIKLHLKQQIPDDEEKVKCMVLNYRTNKVADKITIKDFIFNHEKLQKDLAPYVTDAEYKCQKVFRFLGSPLGIASICLIIIFVIAIIIFFIVRRNKARRLPF